jgi:hypothetical protein
MTTASAVYASAEWLGAADLLGLPGGSIRVTISGCAVRDFDDARQKLALYFVGAKKALLLNRTNALALIDAYGDETDHWTGHPVELYAARVPFRGRIVDAVRLRIPADATASATPTQAIPDPALAASAAFQAPNPAATEKPPF